MITSACLIGTWECPSPSLSAAPAPHFGRDEGSRRCLPEAHSRLGARAAQAQWGAPLDGALLDLQQLAERGGQRLHHQRAAAPDAVRLGCLCATAGLA